MKHTTNTQYFSYEDNAPPVDMDLFKSFENTKFVIDIYENVVDASKHPYISDKIRNLVDGLKIRFDREIHNEVGKEIKLRTRVLIIEDFMPVMFATVSPLTCIPADIEIKKYIPAELQIGGDENTAIGELLYAACENKKRLLAKRFEKDITHLNDVQNLLELGERYDRPITV